jgi:hypothetical protein
MRAAESHPSPGRVTFGRRLKRHPQASERFANRQHLREPRPPNLSVVSWPSYRNSVLIAVVVGAVAVAWGFGLTILFAATAYALLLSVVIRAARKGTHGVALATTAITLALVIVVSLPTTWGTSLFLAPFVTPVAIAAFASPGRRAKWLAAIATFLNVALTAMLVLWSAAP